MADHAPDPAAVAFVGLGKLGHLLVGHLAPVARERGVELGVLDVDAALTARIAADTGTTALSSTGSLPAGRTVLVLCVTNADAVRSVIDDALGNGLLTAGSVVMDLSSVPPDFAVGQAERLAPAGVAYLDVPLTGGIPAARSGEMVAMAGGDRDALDTVTWIAEAFCTKVAWTGASGNGALLKTINNWIGNTAALAAMEGIVMLRRAGLTNETILEVLNGGPAMTYFSATRYPRYLADREAFSGAELGLVTKDLHIAAEAAGHAGATPVVSLLAKDIWQGALTRYGAHGDMLRMLDYVSRSTFGTSWEEIDGV
ncbi:6-phosphogluconate dehydrogenase NAD-binding protein [Pseudonocardia dioxanivorans CB1190]|uniref:6-phosphogluconate dehydrogenase NAD-binding protein n=1 Tax=Pseudonocardia dioxanivorans (strain ATCC 55486 / DSM 44775 / JCM 13855 / CB1190) TaxID=675635 RepID=F4CTQ2_PSEUX|nr:NAD(P)-dependent oxidoreductase [Pseudonocardia dioxanivorans]AEA28555.1 6-phosphogluconate dehydrogenase NAD-binding protein [Pseudonocardia dioxanivorans CB1190]